MKLSKELESFMITSLWWQKSQGNLPTTTGFAIHVTDKYHDEMCKWWYAAQTELSYKVPAAPYYKATVGQYHGVFPASLKDGAYWFSFDSITKAKCG
jgi:hypothetical protein